MQAIVIGAIFALLVWMLRAATPAASLTGGLFTVSLYLWTPGWRTLLWPLLALFLLTFAATRFGRRHKEKLGTAEGKRGRSASQVAANLGVAVIAGIPLSAWHVWMGIYPGRVALIAAIAALSEATADTLSSELGQVLGGEPRLLTTLRRVPPGTDGAISLVGTLAGAAGAAIVTASRRIRLSPDAARIRDRLRRRHRRPLHRQPARSHPRTPRLAEQRRGKCALHAGRCIVRSLGSRPLSILAW